MQEELERKTVAILYNGGKLSARTLARLAAVLVRMAQQAYQKGLTPHGRQSVKKLMNHRTGTEAAEYVGAPRQFDRVARKFNVDYAFYKVAPEKYLLFFKFFLECVLIPTDHLNRVILHEVKKLSFGSDLEYLLEN